MVHIEFQKLYEYVIYCTLRYSYELGLGAGWCCFPCSVAWSLLRCPEMLNEATTSTLRNPLELEKYYIIRRLYLCDKWHQITTKSVECPLISYFSRNCIMSLMIIYNLFDQIKVEDAFIIIS